MGSGSGATPAGRLPRLILRFSLPGMLPDEVYISRRLSIGRTPDNTFVIDDPSVDRHHAIIEVEEVSGRSEYVLCCLQPDSFVEVEGRREQRVVLQPGVRFQLGPAVFECLSAEDLGGQSAFGSACPHCGHRPLPAPAPVPQRCSACGKAIVVVSDTFGRLVALPGAADQLRLLRLVGQGGMAWVWEAEATGLPKHVAVKILMPHVTQDEKLLERYHQELDILKMLRHRRVVRLLGHGRWRGLPFLILEFIAGGTLKDAIAQFRAEGRLCDFPRALSWFLEVLEGLEEVHRLGLVHRDIKPSNILLNERGKAVLADLGIFKRVGHETTSLTATGSGLGTYAYMAPEQWENPSQVDQRADLYSLGVTFYEVLTCQLPFGRWQPPSRLNPSVPAAFDIILEKLLAPRAEDRFASVGEVFQTLVFAGLIRLAPAPGQAPSTCAVPRDGKRPTEAVAGGLNTATAVGRNASHTVVDDAAPVPGESIGGWEAVIPVVLPLLAGGIVVLIGAGGEISALTSLGWILIWVGLGYGVAQLFALLRTGTSIRHPEKRELVPQLSALLPSVASTARVTESLTPSLEGSSHRPEPRPGSPLRTQDPQFLCGHHAWVISVAYSPDGTKILTGSWDNTARLWDATTGKVLRIFEGHESIVTSVAFSPDGTKILTGSWDDTARLWDATSGKLLRVFEGHERSVTSVAFSPDGKKILTGSNDRTARLWDANTGKLLRIFEGHESAVASVAFSPDGKKILTGSDDNTARLWDATTGELVRIFQGHKDLVTSVAFSPDGTKILTGSWDDTARLWDATTGKLLRIFQGHEWHVTSVAFSPDGTKILTGSRDNTARLWDASTGKLLRIFDGHEGPVWSVAFSPDGTKILTGSWDDTARLWDANTGKVLRVFQGHEESVASVAFSPDGTKILTASADNTARLWDASTGKVLRVFQGHEDSVTSVAFSPDGTQILTASTDNTARLWDAGTGSELAAFRHELAVAGVGFLKEGKVAVTAIFGPKIHFWDAVTYEPILTLCCVDQVGQWLVFAPDRRFDASPGAMRYLGLFDRETGRPLSDEEMEKYRTLGLAREILARY